MKKDIYVTKPDYERLIALIERIHPSTARLRKRLILLEEELERARLVESAEVPSETITLHSRVRLRDVRSGEAKTFRLVLPSEGGGAEGALSILAPMGIAMLGYGEGDRFECETPGGVGEFLVESVLYQPEAEARRLPPSDPSPSEERAA